jgi:hypothetical protein
MSSKITLPPIPAGQWVKNGDTWCTADRYAVTTCGCGDVGARLMIITGCCQMMSASTRHYTTKIDAAPECDGRATVPGLT